MKITLCGKLKIMEYILKSGLEDYIKIIEEQQI